MLLYEINKAVEIMRLNRDKNDKQCYEIKSVKTDEKEISFGEVLHKAISNRK